MQPTWSWWLTSCLNEWLLSVKYSFICHPLFQRTFFNDSLILFCKFNDLYHKNCSILYLMIAWAPMVWKMRLLMIYLSIDLYVNKSTFICYKCTHSLWHFFIKNSLESMKFWFFILKHKLYVLPWILNFKEVQLSSQGRNCEKKLWASFYTQGIWNYIHSCIPIQKIEAVWVKYKKTISDMHWSFVIRLKPKGQVKAAAKVMLHSSVKTRMWRCCIIQCIALAFGP